MWNIKIALFGFIKTFRTRSIKFTEYIGTTMVDYAIYSLRVYLYYTYLIYRHIILKLHKLHLEIMVISIDVYKFITATNKCS